ncbi:MAG: GTPase domain-containing protein [Chitinophagales bacterium]
MAEFFLTALGAASSTLKVAESSRSMFSKMDMILRYLKQGNVRVIIFGAGGTGKSTLEQVLIGNESKLIPDYQESLTIEKSKMKGDVIGSFLTAPGQENRIAKDWGELYAMLKDNKVKGIINVVSYGYHSVPFSLNNFQNHPLYETGMNKEDFLMLYCKKQRGREIELLERLKTRLIDTPKKIWMLTLVTKQDLWWSQREEVKKHYLESRYNKIIQEIVYEKGNQNFHHEYLSASLIINNFRMGNEMMLKTVEGYDRVVQLLHLNQLVNTVGSYIRQ